VGRIISSLYGGKDSWNKLQTERVMNDDGDDEEDELAGVRRNGISEGNPTIEQLATLIRIAPRHGDTYRNSEANRRFCKLPISIQAVVSPCAAFRACHVIAASERRPRWNIHEAARLYYTNKTSRQTSHKRRRRPTTSNNSCEFSTCCRAPHTTKLHRPKSASHKHALIR